MSAPLDLRGIGSRERLSTPDTHLRLVVRREVRGSKFAEAIVSSAGDVLEEDVASHIEVSVLVVAVPDVHNPEATVALLRGEKAVAHREGHVIVLVLPSELAINPVGVDPRILILNEQRELSISLFAGSAMKWEAYKELKTSFRGRSTIRAEDRRVERVARISPVRVGPHAQLT